MILFQRKIGEIHIYTDPVTESSAACAVMMNLYGDFYYVAYFGYKDPRTCKGCHYKGNFGELFQPNCNKLKGIFDGLIYHLDPNIADEILPRGET